MLKKKDLIRSFARSNKGIIVAASVAGIISTATAILIPLFIGKYYQLALHTHSTRAKLFAALFGNVDDIHFFFLLMALLLAVKFLFNFLEKYYAGICGERFANMIRKKLFTHQLKTEMQNFEHKPVGNYLLRYSGDLTAVVQYFTKGNIQFFNDCLFLAGAVLLLGSLSMELTTIVVVALPVIFFINYLLNGTIKKRTRARRNIRSNNLAFVTYRLKSLATVKLFNRENVEADKFNRRADKLYRAGVKYQRSYALSAAIYLLFVYSVLTLILWSAYQLLEAGTSDLDGAAVITYIMMMISIIPVLKRMMKINIIFVTGNVSFRKLLSIFNTPEEDGEEINETELRPGAIVFDHVSFQYDNSPVLKDLNAYFPSRSITRLCGEQGTGKTTIFKLISGLYSPQTGEIRIRDINIRTVNRHTLRKNIALVSDELPLIGDTIFETISYSRKEEKKPAALEMLKMLGFELPGVEFILEQPVSEGGKNLSAGQRKLLMIARALLTHKRILLLDEPFKDLSAPYREKVIEVLETLRSKYTIIIIDSDHSPLHYDQTIQISNSPAYA